MVVKGVAGPSFKALPAAQGASRASCGAGNGEPGPTLPQQAPARRPRPPAALTTPQCSPHSPLSPHTETKKNKFPRSKKKQKNRRQAAVPGGTPTVSAARCAARPPRRPPPRARHGASLQRPRARARRQRARRAPGGPGACDVALRRLFPWTLLPSLSVAGGWWWWWWYPSGLAGRGGVDACGLRACQCARRCARGVRVQAPVLLDLMMMM